VRVTASGAERIAQPPSTGSSCCGHTHSGSDSQARCAGDTPALRDNARFVQIAEEFTAEAFIAQLVMKALQYARSPMGSRA
jgi:hypothetical protein